jgi:demethylmenaquinone methyltransferase / 2-methoxy-6-polyprenyl-1,4-benzoquinol methylase
MDAVDREAKQKLDTLISAEENRAMFDRISLKYDAASQVVSLGMARGWRRKAVAELSPFAEGRYLDIGTGTGDLIFELLHQQPNARIDGVDAAGQMLEVARAKMLSLGLEKRVQLFSGDACSLPFAGELYDGVVTGFCFRNIAFRDRALQEMYRVLRPGGKVVILEATYPEQRWVQFAYHLYLPFVPCLGRLMGGGSAFKYLVDSIANFPSVRVLREQIGCAGFVRFTTRSLVFGAISVFSAEKPYEDED